MIRRQNSLPEILSIISDKKPVSIPKQPPLQLQDTDPTPVFRYILHEPQERIQLAKMFYKNLKQRLIARNLNHVKSMAELNGVKLKSGQIVRQQLYVEQKQQQEDPKIYLRQQNIEQRGSPVRRSRTSTFKQSFIKTTDQTKNESTILVRKSMIEIPQKVRQVDEVKGQAKLFTIVYKSLKYQN